MDFKKKFNETKEKIKTLDWRKVVTTKAFITVGCVMLVCAAVLVSSLVNRDTDPVGGTEGDKILGNTLLVDASGTDTEAGADVDVNADPETAEDFFAMAIINRTQVRDSALEVLREIASNPDTLPDAKEDALDSISQIADDMSAEANIETLVKAKGIADCVAVISGDSCSVVVNKSGLNDEELTQITDIVFDQTGIKTQNITVVEAK